MKKNVDKNGELKISFRKIFVMSLITAFFTLVAKKWEFKHRYRFIKKVKYKKYDTDYLKKVLEDFKILSTCKDPYIENFYKKHNDFSSLHKLWVLNSHSYWIDKFNKELSRRTAK